jgi:hypothetical protein
VLHGVSEGLGRAWLDTARLWVFHDVRPWAWQRDAVALVYAHDGEAVRYAGRTVEAPATVWLPDGSTRAAVTASPLALALARAIDERPLWRLARLAVDVAEVRRRSAAVEALPRGVVRDREERAAWAEYERARNFARTSAERDRIAARQRATVWSLDGSPVGVPWGE